MASDTQSVAPAVLERAARIKLVLLDSDGVLTDGRLVMSWGPDGLDARAFHTRDGLGIRLGQRAGLLFGIVSGRDCKAVDTRARELTIDEVHQGVGDKLERMRQIRQRHDVAEAEVCFVGDDWPDVPVMRHCGLAAAPADAAAEVRELAHFVAECGGGRGAVREVVELILRASGEWDRVVQRYFK